MVLNDQFKVEETSFVCDDEQPLLLTDRHPLTVNAYLGVEPNKTRAAAMAALDEVRGRQGQGGVSMLNFDPPPRSPAFPPLAIYRCSFLATPRRLFPYADLGWKKLVGRAEAQLLEMWAKGIVEKTCGE